MGALGFIGDIFGGDAPENQFDSDTYKFDKSIGTVAGQNTRLFDQAAADTAYRRVAPTMTPAQMAAANIDMAPQGEFRGQQMGLAKTLQQRIAGEATSPAEMQARQGIAQAVANAKSQAAGATSANRALANKQAMDVAATLGQKANADAAILRAQEGMAAENSLGNVLGAGRIQDAGLATTQAGLAQDASKTNAGFVQGANTENLRSTLETQKQIDSMVQYYLNQGFARDVAEQQARADLERLRAGEHGRMEMLNSGVAAQNVGIAQSNQQLPFQIAGNVVGAAAG